MSWLFSQALVESLGASFSDGEPSAPLNVMPTAQPFLHRDKTTAFLSRSQYGLTCRHLTGVHGEVLLTSYLAGFHARIFQSPERVLALQAQGQDSGSISHESSERWNQLSFSLRTSHPSEL